jgi:hypothetical protein
MKDEGCYDPISALYERGKEYAVSFYQHQKEVQ